MTPKSVVVIWRKSSSTTGKPSATNCRKVKLNEVSLETLRNLGVDPPFSHEALMDAWNRMFKFGLLFGTAALSGTILMGLLPEVGNKDETSTNLHMRSARLEQLVLNIDSQFSKGLKTTK